MHLSIFHRVLIAVVTVIGLNIGATVGKADDKVIVLQSTTSTQNSGLYDFLLPKFKAASGITVRVVAVGTGQALRNAANGDGDVLIVHAKSAEEQFVADGFGVSRQDLMYNDFVMVGSSDDPAKVETAGSAKEAMARIAAASAAFASRGDNSGTHKKELQLWAAAGIDPTSASGTWYRELGSGMGATLNTAALMGAYALTDRATWISFNNKQTLKVLVSGDPALFNQYGIILVNPEKHPHVKRELAQSFIDWMVGTDGQAAIASYKLRGEQLFKPNAK